jgi:hypothetical protein
MTEMLPIRDARPKEFFWAHNRLIDDYGPIIGADGVAVYMALCRHAGESQTCWPSYQTVADELCLSRPTVVKAIKKLVAVGLVAAEQRANPDHPDLHLSNLYTLLAITPLDEGGKGRLLGVVKEINHPGKPALPGVVKDVYIRRIARRLKRPRVLTSRQAIRPNSSLLIVRLPIARRFRPRNPRARTRRSSPPMSRNSATPLRQWAPRQKPRSGW